MCCGLFASGGSTRPLGASGTSLSCSPSAVCTAVAGGCRGAVCAAVLRVASAVSRLLPRSRLKAAIACGRGSATGLDKLNLSLLLGRRTVRHWKFVCGERTGQSDVNIVTGHVARVMNDVAVD
ncbi:hypothetical protein PR003_g30 [Phytophthora rubi]|uniref:Uncharacterized protein n=1 Tax=Phytophthora rubi TaxID=129364 RepID=A0A6A3P9E6_9STRA|nr:hypothetical protein PR002_g31 [Phytophthora rubi]KAE9052920.1 hypothetical protein PR001_g31 [Phytophthora rubi]KAE9360686.1 hypothetical protein PR003_g30 [Phytophthora rubi]